MRLTLVAVGTLLAFSLAWLPAGKTAATVRPAAAFQDSTDHLLKQRSLGSADAPVTVFEMSDFQCPYCRRHALETFPELKRKYVDTGKIRWVFVNFPLTQLHPNAAAAAEFAMCAARADKFWPVHDLLYRNQDTWAPLKDPAPFFFSLADSVGLPRKELTACLQSGFGQRIVKEDAEGAAHAGANSTPTFFIEGGLLAGAAPASAFEPILDSIYQAKTTAKQ